MPFDRELTIPDWLWTGADAVRAKGRAVDAVAVLRELVAAGRRPQWRELGELSRIDPGAPEHEDPVLIAEFAVALGRTRGDQLAILDPWAGLGVTMAALNEAGLVRRGMAIEINESVWSAAKELWAGSRIEWVLGDAASVLEDGAETFDLIVGSPPIGLPHESVRVGAQPIRLSASRTYTMLLQAGMRLAPDGVMAVVLADEFFRPQNLGVRDALAAAGIHVSGVLAVPSRTYRSTGISMSVVVFDRRVHDQLFVGLLDSPESVEGLVKNLTSRKPGRFPQLGILTDAGTFRSWRALARDRDLREAARRSGLRVVPLGEAVRVVNRPRSKGEPFDETANSVYLPRLGRSPAVTSLDRLHIKPQNYVQLVCDREVCDPEYLAGFFNSPAGLLVREDLSTGTTIPSVSLDGLKAGYLLLPPSIRQQRNAVRVASELRDLSLGVEALEAQLWDRPLDAAKVSAALTGLKGGDGFDQWAESLPFPLASILRRYLIAESAERRCRYLINFFEGAAVFIVDLLISGLRGDPTSMVEVTRPDRSAASTYSRGTIGTWSDLLARLASQVRGLVETSPETAMELFAVADIGRLRAVSSKALVRVLKEEAPGYRNNWIGHAAVVGDPEWKRRLAIAENALATVREALGVAFIGWHLTRPGPGARRNGVITTSIEDLTGSHREFRKTTVDLRELPDADRLYMLETGASLMLKMGPLIRLRHGPESVEDACYFYDRLDGAAVRWVSYHYEPEAEFEAPDTEVAGFIEELGRLG